MKNYPYVKNMTAGRPPTRTLQILELWISIVDRASDLQIDSGFNINNLKNRLLNSNLYIKNRDYYQQAILRLQTALQTGIKHDLFECEKGTFWNLSREVISIIKSEKFKEERKEDFETSIRTIWETLRDNTWRDYYNPKPISTIQIPHSLNNLRFQIQSSGNRPKWINPEGIQLEDIKAGYFPAKTIKTLKIRIEEQWRKNKIVTLVANPAQGKTTGVSILSYWWEKEAINNIIFMFEAKRWADIQFDFEKYIEEVTVFDKVIIILENIHLTSQLNNIKRLNKKENINFILTSRKYEEKLKPFRNSDQYTIIPIPASYSKELLALFLRQYGKAFTKNKQLIHSLLKDNVNQNILFLLTHTVEKIGKEEIFAWDKFILELEERFLKRDDSDKYYWRWILYSLASMRYFELNISKQTLFDIIKLYDDTLSRKYLGRTFTALEENGIINSLDYEKNKHKLVFHPNVAEKIREYYSSDIAQIIGDLSKIDDKLFKLWLENKEKVANKRFYFISTETETLIRKIGYEKYNKLDLDFEFWKEKVLSIKIDPDNYFDFYKKTHFIALNFKQKNLKKLIPHILDETYFMQFLLSDSLEIEIPEIIPEFERIKIKENILDSIDVSSIDLSKFFDEFKYNIDLGSSDDGYFGMEYRGYRAFYYLSHKHPKFKEDIEYYIRSLYNQEKFRNFLETIFRIPKNLINQMDFQYITKDIQVFEKIQFLVNNHMIEIDGDFFVQTTYELLELWNGPKLECLASILLQYIAKQIKENQDFIENNKHNFSRPEIDIWIDNVEIQEQLENMDLITEFNIEQFMEKEPKWIRRRLEFINKYNPQLYRYVLKFNKLRSKLLKIANKNYDSIVLKDLGIRPSILDLPRHNIEIEDIQSVNFTQLKKKIEQDPFTDWARFLQILLEKLKHHRLDNNQSPNKLTKIIEDLIEFVSILRSKTSKEKYLSILQSTMDSSLSYETKIIDEIVRNFFDSNTLNISEIIKLGDNYESKFNKGFRTKNLIWDLGYSTLESSDKQTFIKELLRQDRKFKCFQGFIKGDFDRTIFTKSLIQIINENEINLLAGLMTKNDVRDLTDLLDCSQAGFFLDLLLNSESKNSDKRFFFLLEITKKLKEKNTLHNFIFQLKKFNSLALFNLYINLSDNEVCNFLQFLFKEWPDERIYQKVCHQIGTHKMANLLGKTLGILKSKEEEKTSNYYKRNKGFLIENEMATDILTELLMMVNYKNLDSGEENRIILTIVEYLDENQKESLIEELPFILMKVVNEKNIHIFELINPKDFNKIYGSNFTFLIQILSSFQHLQIEMRQDIKKLIEIWTSAESRYNRLKVTEFNQIIESIWNWNDFRDETQKWDANTRETLFSYLFEDLVEAYKGFKGINTTFLEHENKSEFQNIIIIINLIYTWEEKTEFLQLKLDEILLNEDLNALNSLIRLLGEEYEDLLELIFKDYTIEEWMFYYTLKIQDNDFMQDYNLEKIIELISILNEIKEKLSFSFDEWLYCILKLAPKELIFLFFEQIKLELSKEQIRKILNLKEFQKWNQRDIFQLLLKSTNVKYFNDLWDEMEIAQRKLPSTSTELNYGLALLFVLKFSNKNEGIYEELMTWLKSIETLIYPLMMEFKDEYKIILEVFLGLDLDINLSKSKSAFLSMLNHPGIDFYAEDNPYSEHHEILNNGFNSAKIWNYYWIKQKNTCLDFIENINFEHAIRLLKNKNLFEIFIENIEIQEVIIESIKYDKFADYIKQMKRYKSFYQNIPALSVFNDLLKSSIRQKILDSLAIEDFKLIKKLLIKYFSSEITSGLSIINQIKNILHDIESQFILEYEKEDNLYGFSNSLANTIVKRSASAQEIISNLEYTKKYLPEIHRHTVLNSTYSMVRNYLRDSTSSSNYQEVIWYLGTLDLWKINAVNLARELTKESYYRDYELPFIIIHSPDLIDDRIKGEIKKELENERKYKSDKNSFREKMKNILLSWSKNNF